MKRKFILLVLVLLPLEACATAEATKPQVEEVARRSNSRQHYVSLNELGRGIHNVKQGDKERSQNPKSVRPSPSQDLRLLKEAEDTAVSAKSIAQSAQAPDDWNLVASQWQQAIKVLEAIPDSSAQRALAKQNIIEYQRQLARARQQATKPPTQASPPTSFKVINVYPKENLESKSLEKPLRRSRLSRGCGSLKRRSDIEQDPSKEG